MLFASKRKRERVDSIKERKVEGKVTNYTVRGKKRKRKQGKKKRSKEKMEGEEKTREGKSNVSERTAMERL